MDADIPLIKNKVKEIQCRRGLHQETVQTRSMLQKNEDYDAICMGQLRAFSPWTSKGHQGMVQTRSMTRIAEETSPEEVCMGTYWEIYTPQAIF